MFLRLVASLAPEAEAGVGLGVEAGSIAGRTKP